MLDPKAGREPKYPYFDEEENIIQDGGIRFVIVVVIM